MNIFLSGYRSSFSVFVKTAHTLAENSENCKVLQLRNLIVETLALCGTTLPYKNGLKTIILQDLNYLDHLAEVDADVLAKMSAIQEDTTLIDNILQHVGGIPFSVDDGPAAKIVSAFLLKLTVSDTKTVLRNVSALADFLDSDLYTMRMSMLEVFAILYCHLMLQEDRGDQARTQARSFLSAIEERLRDVNSFVRSKVLHVLFELVQASALPVPDRARLIELVVGRVMDKSSNVRRRAIQLLGEFLRKHPFCVDGGELSLKLFQDRLHDIDSHLDAIEPAEIKDSMMGSNEQLAIPSAEEELAKAQTMQTLLMQKRYYTDALTFVRQLDSVIPTLCKLLSSNIKTEVFEVMDFFVDSFVYKLHSSELGIKKMMHLIWEQDLSSEDGTKKSIKEHVLNCYRKVFLDVDARLEGKERVMSIASTLISLVSSSSIGDLASLEQIIAGFVKKGWIVESVIQALFSRRDNPEEQRSALILITMIGKHLPEIMSSRVDVVMKIGFGPLGQADSMVAEYTCIALRLLNGGDMKGSSDSTIRLPNDHVIFFKLVNMIKTVSASSRWLQFIAQAILTIYALADQPNVICGSLIQELSHDITEAANGHVRLGTLIKLIFIVGHVAVCELDHLEAIEKHLKRSKSKRPSIDSSMEGITATEEDDIVDAMRFIRENELLYGKDSILAVFGPFVASICSNNNIYPVLASWFVFISSGRILSCKILPL